MYPKPGLMSMLRSWKTCIHNTSIQARGPGEPQPIIISLSLFLNYWSFSLVKKARFLLADYSAWGLSNRATIKYSNELSAMVLETTFVPAAFVVSLYLWNIGPNSKHHYRRIDRARKVADYGLFPAPPQMACGQWKYVVIWRHFIWRAYFFQAPTPA